MLDLKSPSVSYKISKVRCIREHNKNREQFEQDLNKNVYYLEGKYYHLFSRVLCVAVMSVCWWVEGLNKCYMDTNYYNFNNIYGRSMRFRFFRSRYLLYSSTLLLASPSGSLASPRVTTMLDLKSDMA